MRLISLAAALAAVACASPTSESGAPVPPRAAHAHEPGAEPAHDQGAAHAHGHAHGAAHSHDDPRAGCTCATAPLANAWCGEHRLGYVCGQPIASRVLFDALDAHGHDLDRDVMQCTTCKRMMDEGGFCVSCRFGWVGGQAYMSLLTYRMALGEVRDTRALACATCRDQAGDVGWCEACAGGWTGNVFFVDRDDYSAATREFRRLEAAIEVSLRCETCAQVILVDGTCPYCKIRWEDGVAVGG